MALLDIVLYPNEYRFIGELPTGTIGTSLKDIVSRAIGLRYCFQHKAVFPVVGDVRSGIQYGSTGVEFTGTYAGGGGSNTYSRGRIVNEQ